MTSAKVKGNLRIYPLIVKWGLCGVLVLGLVCSSSNFKKRSEPFPHSSMNSNRSALYQQMAAEVEKAGLQFLNTGKTSQSLKLAELFSLDNAIIRPVLKPAEPPVRAIVLYLDYQFARKLEKTVKRILSAHFPHEIWYQDPKLYHFSMFHASHHLEPVAVDSVEVENEIKSVQWVAKQCCPLKIKIERVVLTSSGVLVGCWQMMDGTDPFTIRGLLQSQLPRAPSKQLYDSIILHSTFARILGFAIQSIDANFSLFSELVDKLNRELSGIEAIVRELWYVEELDILALALNGRTKIHRFALTCPGDVGN